MRESRYNIWLERDDDSYVFNGVSGCLLRLRSADRDALGSAIEHDDATAMPADVLERLVAGRMVVADDSDEIAMLSRRYSATRHDPTAFGLTIVTSLGCNFDCPYCFEAKHPSLLNAEVQTAILRLLDEKLPTIRRFQVTWFGGEPLVGRRSLFALSGEFTRRCDAADVEYTAGVVTNGYFLDDRTARELALHRVSDVQVGLDGPPDVHDRMRPLRGGQGTFWRIVENLHHALEHLDVTVRVNLDEENWPRAEELLQILAAEGFAGRLGIYAAQLVSFDDGVAAPAASYQPACLTKRDFARVESEFNRLATAYGFMSARLPGPLGAPCTAVRANELVIGSEGEIYKCWDSVGNPNDALGSIFDSMLPDTRSSKWLLYDPFQDDDCRQCVALPVCMGGCAHHALAGNQNENKCGTFRHTYRQQIATFIESADAGEQDFAQLSRRSLTRTVEPR